jgi:hypothetical protein
MQIQCMEGVDDPRYIPLEIESVLTDFDTVFYEPTTLPPTQSFVNTITLEPKAKHVNL